MDGGPPGALALTGSMSPTLISGKYRRRTAIFAAAMSVTCGTLYWRPRPVVLASLFTIWPNHIGSSIAT
jgi:hypothetical protein